MEITQMFLLVSAVMMEIPMMMILLSKVLPYKPNKILNIVAAILLTLIQAGSLFVRKPTLHYIFFSVIEIATTLFILWYSLNWKKDKAIGSELYFDKDDKK